VGSALTETENWDLLVDCTSRDGRQMLDAHIANEDAHTVSKTVQNILPNPLLLLQMVKKQQILLFLKMLSNLSCLVFDRSSVMKKIKYTFNERRENLLKKKIPAFSVQGKSRSTCISVLQKNLVTIIQNISES
jgi:hypothetical protein